MPSARIIGPGRAGTALALALADAGWTVDRPLGRGDDVTGAARGVDVVVVATPDSAIAEVAAAVTPGEAAIVHLSGSRGLDVLEPHERRASLHPLVSLAEGARGARLLRGAAFAVAGDAVVERIVADLDGRAFAVEDDKRTAYHAAACIASNHLVALLGQVERVAEAAGVPLDAYLDLARQTLDNVATLGPTKALTGPVARGDHETVRRHLGALDPLERPAYEAMAEAARRLVSR